MNLLKETLQQLQDNNLNESDVLWCGSKQFGYFTWEDFKSLANIDYNNGYGSPEVAEDLMIATKEGFFKRREYDGSEWWEYITIPKKPEKYKKPTALTINQAIFNGLNVSCGWEDLVSLNCEYKLVSLNSEYKGE